MKKFFIILITVLLVGFSIASAENYESTPATDGECKKSEEKKQECPFTKMQEKCLYCHTVPSFALKEVAPDATLSYPNSNTKIIGKVGYYFLEDIDADRVRAFFEYISWHDVDHIVIEIQSPGGSLFNAWRIVGLMDYWKSKGYVIETRVHGFAASAGFLIFANGSLGHRFASKTCELMWHELTTFKFFAIEGPSDKEDEARTLRHLQTTANTWLAARSKLSAEEWDKRIRKKEWWCNGKQAKDEYGLSDGEPIEVVK